MLFLNEIAGRHAANQRLVQIPRESAESCAFRSNVLLSVNLDVLFSTLIPSMILLDLLVAPYTKVEESFNIQATHDILKYGIPWRKADANVWQEYDHLTFSGSVPRTFVGPIALAGASKPFIWLAEKWIGELTTGRQIIIRAVLGLFNALCLISFKDGVARTFGRDAANWYAVFQAGQFHMMYYASRTLPNFLAFGLSKSRGSNWH